MGRFQDVLARNDRLTEAEPLGPDSVDEVHHQIGQTLQSHDPEGAISTYENAQGLYQKSSSYYGLGQALKRRAEKR